MLYYFIALLITSAVLIIHNVRNETNRWAAFFLASAAIGGLTDVLVQFGLPRIADLVHLLNVTLTPYGVLIFSMVYAERISRPTVRAYLKLVLLLPVFMMLLTTKFTPAMHLNEGLLLVWSAPYYLLSCYWLIISLVREQDRRRKRSRLVVTAIVVPTLLAVLFLIYVGNIVSPGFDFFPYISLFIVYSLTLALLGSFVYGVLGVKVRIERDPLESMLESVSAGTSMLNHAIKNELGKIAISTENLKQFLPEENKEAYDQLQIITNSYDHMFKIVERLHERMKPLNWRQAACRLDLLVDEWLQHYRPLFTNQKIHIKTSYGDNSDVLCDPVHVREVINNLLDNAIDAMPEGGLIEIQLKRLRRSIRVSIRDTGQGIPAAQLPFIFEPFHSTKQNGQLHRVIPTKHHSLNVSYGLGLSYVYHVMRKSGGSVEVNSREGEGTVVTLVFPVDTRKKKNGMKDSATFSLPKEGRR